MLYSNPSAYALESEEKNGIETRFIKRKSYENFEDYDKALTDLLISLRADLIVLAGFMTILGPKVIHAFENRIINIHPSLIPAFCGEGYYGLKVHEAALARGVKVTGATAHFVNEICDGGPIILQQCVPIENTDTPQTLQKRVMEQAEWNILPRAVALFCEDKIEVIGNITRIKGE